MQDPLHPTVDEISEYYFRSDAEKRFRRVIYDFFGLGEAHSLDDDVCEFKSEIERKYTINIPEAIWIQFRLDVIAYIRQNLPPNIFSGLVERIEKEYNTSFPDVNKFKTIDDILEHLYNSNLAI